MYVNFDGSQQRCFHCLNEGHLIANCPDLRSESYSTSVITGAATAGAPVVASTPHAKRTKRKLRIRKKRKQAEEATEEPRSVRIKDNSDYETPAWLKSILERTSQDHKEEIPDIFDGKSLKNVLTEYAELHMDNEHVFEFETNEMNDMYFFL